MLPIYSYFLCIHSIKRDTFLCKKRGILNIYEKVGKTHYEKRSISVLINICMLTLKCDTYTYILKILIYIYIYMY